MKKCLTINCHSLPGVCPVLCSGRGAYGGGRCHCEAGWTGAECDQPYSDLSAASSSTGGGFVISCSIPCSVHGTCVNGRCQCDAEHTGASCETRKLTGLLCSPAQFSLFGFLRNLMTIETGSRRAIEPSFVCSLMVFDWVFRFYLVVLCDALVAMATH